MPQNCPICHALDSKEILSFGNQPNSYNFLESKQAVAEKYPLALHMCGQCGFTFIPEPFPAASMYANYHWATSFYPAPHTAWLVQEIGKHATPPSDDLIVDIGCNDGYLLGKLKAAGFSRLLGIEPSGDCARIARESGLPVVEGYFDQAQAANVLDRYGRARVIVCKQVLEHVHEPLFFIGAIDHLLHPSGLLVLEIPDFELIAKKGDFSNIWEQHVGYYTLASVVRMLEGFELYIQSYHRIEYGGGSLLLFIGRKQKEMDIAIENHQIVEGFVSNVHSNLQRFEDIVMSFKAKSASLSFFGGGARGISMLNLSGVGRNFDCVADDNPGKQGLYIPGCELPVVSSEKLFSTKSGCCFLSPLNSKSAEEKILTRFSGTGISFVEFFPGHFQEPVDFFKTHFLD